MKNCITCLTDYKGNFVSKWNDVPYRSGMDKELLKKYFLENDINIEFKKFSEIDFGRTEISGNLFFYTSSEDMGSHYKSYIEDIILGIQEKGGKVIPKFNFLRAHNNKVFMEILRKNLGLPGSEGLESNFFGTLEELLEVYKTMKYPAIFKLAEGSSGSNVVLVKNREELLAAVKKYCRTSHIKYDFRDIARVIKRKGYKKESLYRSKFIIQSFVSNLQNDWKVYVFYNKYYIFYRPIFKHRVFKASGGGYDNYFFGNKANAPDGIFNFAERVYKALDVPYVSLDIGFDGKSFYLFEFQCLYFGTAGIVYSDEYFMKRDKIWIEVKNDKDIEKAYVESLVNYIKKKNENFLHIS